MTVFNSVDDEQVKVREGLVRAARDMRADLIARAEHVERDTFYDSEVHQRFQELGFYRMLIPEAQGGLEVDLATFYRVVIELARADMSTAWCFCLSTNHALMFGNWFPREIHDEVYDGGRLIAASMYAPTTRATPVDGGWKLDGTVNYCSGIPYSTHFIGQCVLPGTNADGGPRMGLYVAPEDAYTRLDDWGNMLGLNGSGSHSIVFDDAFLPDRYLVEDVNLADYGFDGHSPGSQAYGNPMYSGRHMSSFGIGVAALTIGGAYNALDEYENVMRTRKTPLPPSHHEPRTPISCAGTAARWSSFRSPRRRCSTRSTAGWMRRAPTSRAPNRSRQPPTTCSAGSGASSSSRRGRRLTAISTARSEPRHPNAASGSSGCSATWPRPSGIGIRSSRNPPTG
ncbi:acyl-CoA dehydrogenase family protein [Saccharopolyspora endophytica]|uniref:Acyl-CoA dehydrogenase family protein n=1 Tax=Saccharopolyspora endophytica TaxID=543886 RepID=A0ABS5DB37_9PSEU|nr:acyl-CoA dehydrogenase family protein [Saccharopolyspora endophytica]MBQ0923473.1 acyl-CoA dehydrogenase family protein [Saccharopolyspora endophytica]